MNSTPTITVKRYALYRVLKRMCKVVNDTSYNELLRCVALRGSKGILTITGVDVIPKYVGLSATIKASGDFEFGINCKQLTRILKCKRTDDTEVTLRAASAELDLMGKVEILMNGFTVEVNSFSLEDFPQFVKRASTNWKEVAVVTAETFASRFNYVRAAVCDDETRPHINAMLFTKGCLVGTDGHRMHQAGVLETDDHPDFQIPSGAARTMAFLLKGAGNIQIKLNKDKTIAQFVIGSDTLGQVDWEYNVALAVSQFPPYDQIIPTDFELSAVVETKKLVDVFSQIKMMIDDFSTATNLKITDDQIAMSAAHADFASVNYKLDCATEQLNGKRDEETDLEIFVCAEYMIEALEHSFPETDILLGGALDPILVRSGFAQAVVMPRRK
jgi:DNA polymerase III sliding clamp (beta) subunit (PCNA family)